MNSPLADLLFKEYRRRVLGLLLLHPEQSFHVREIARLTGTVAGTLHKELSKLADAGLLLKMTQGNQVSYQANRNGLIFNELASILRKTSGIADVLAEALAPLAQQIEFALVFGSVASGKARVDSDIDLLIVANVGFSEVVKALYPAQQQLRREINPKLYLPEEWKLALLKRSVFVDELLGKPVIKIIGDMDDTG
ncbi:MAG: nucleotidyltransferase [Cellvibrio sp.]|jgi:predicted nucleotidyltransferase|nr:nucleotidyltransferase [Cellvibrio sp.]